MSSKVKRISKKIPALTKEDAKKLMSLYNPLYSQRQYEDYKARADLMSYPLNKRYR